MRQVPSRRSQRRPLKQILTLLAGDDGGGEDTGNYDLYLERQN